jgi:hypothetical protein
LASLLTMEVARSCMKIRDGVVDLDGGMPDVLGRGLHVQQTLVDGLRRAAVPEEQADGAVTPPYTACHFIDVMQRSASRCESGVQVFTDLGQQSVRVFYGGIDVADRHWATTHRAAGLSG